MPSHGGGKRFDEEQRVVSAAIRHAAMQMDLSEIKGKRVALDFANLETSGTGQAFYPGLGNVSAFAGYSDTDILIDRIQNPGPITGFGNPTNNYSSDDSNERWDSRATGNFQFNPSLRTNNNITREDINYLKKVVEMQLRHKGFQIVQPAKADVMLYVLVDVLGTNLSRTDFGVAYKDDLGASCELTYYAINPSNQLILSPSKSVGSYGLFEETNVRFSPFRFKDRSVEKHESTLISIIPNESNATAVSDVGLHKGNGASLDSQLDALYQRALIQIESNNRKGASDSIRKIRKLKPDYQSLPELEQSLSEL